MQYYADFVGKRGAAKSSQKKRAVRLDSLPAQRVRAEYTGAAGLVVEEVVIAVRKNIVYEIGLRTTKDHYTDDLQRYEKLLSGFHVWRIHYC